MACRRYQVRADFAASRVKELHSGATMIIENSTALAFSASHETSVQRELSESLQVWRGSTPDSAAATLAANLGEPVFISAAARDALAREKAARPSAAAPAIDRGSQLPEAPDTQAASEVDGETESLADPRLNLIRRMVEMITGQKIRLLAVDLSSAGRVERSTAALANVQTAGNDWGARYEAHTVYEQIERTSFAAAGVVRTRDGREVQFSLQIEMHSALREETTLVERFGNAQQAKDPLLINFSGTAPQLLDQTFHFDLDADGQQEALPRLASGSAYLVFDRNANGRVDDGKELFGPATDDGFGELTALDVDGNGWVDEADPAFQRLGVWRAAGDGQSTVQTLADAGIGALSTAHLDTALTLRGASQQALGALRSSGVALRENGQALALQHVDLMVS